MKEVTIPAKAECLDDVFAFVKSELDVYGCPEDIEMQVMLAVEEIFVNIAHYAYDPHIGAATVRCGVSEDPLQVTIQFMDGGKPYNPLKRKTPDVTLSAEERKIGGLGVYLVKKQMDNVKYEYVNDKNILTICKRLKT